MKFKPGDLVLVKGGTSYLSRKHAGKIRKIREGMSFNKGYFLLDSGSDLAWDGVWENEIILVSNITLIEKLVYNVRD